MKSFQIFFVLFAEFWKLPSWCSCKKINNKRPEVFRKQSSPRDLLFVYRFYVLRNRTGGPELKDYWINCGRQRRKSTHHSIFSLWWLSYTLSIFSSAPHNLKEKKIRRKLNNLQLKNDPRFRQMFNYCHQSPLPVVGLRFLNLKSYLIHIYVTFKSTELNATVLRILL